jgi:hypothetical protein
MAELLGLLQSLAGLVRIGKARSALATEPVVGGGSGLA